MESVEKPVIWLHGEIKTPPFSKSVRIEAGFLIRKLQIGEKLSLPQSRPMPSIGVRVHELRITDEDKIWRIVYRIDSDVILIAEVFSKKTTETPKEVIRICKKRIMSFENEFNA